MDLTTSLIALVSLVVGLIAGSLLARSVAPGEKQRRELEDNLKQTREEYKAYQQQVNEHFVQTAAMLHEMSQGYRNLGEHLASGAMTLAAPETGRRIIDAATPQPGELPHKSLVSTSAEPPKDYAPSVPGGVLSENYGYGEEEGESSSLYVRGLHNKPSSLASNHDSDDDPTLKVS